MGFTHKSSLKNKIVDFSDFIRFEISFLSAFVGVLGYVMFNHPSLELIFVFISSFCAAAFCFAYNNAKDVEEDAINRKRVSSLTTKRIGVPVLFVIFLTGLLSSFSLVNISTILYLSMISIGTVYTYFRLNLRSFSHLIKNLYGALGLPIIFLLGAGSLKTEVIIYYFLFSIFIFGGSIVADLRDYTGDKKIGKKTVPVVVGYSKSKIISCAIILAFASLIFCLELKSFFLLGAASLLMIVLVAKDMPKHAHLTGGLSFLVTSLWLLILH